jgi:hypothetical protein
MVFESVFLRRLKDGVLPTRLSPRMILVLASKKDERTGIVPSRGPEAAR